LVPGTADRAGDHVVPTERSWKLEDKKRPTSSLQNETDLLACSASNVSLTDSEFKSASDFVESSAALSATFARLGVEAQRIFFCQV
jgi:hypothetical protein